MYESPIKLYEAMEMAKENEIHKAIYKVGVTVDKDELIKALAYDRERYEKGFNDGYAIGRENGAVRAHWVWVKIEDGDSYFELAECSNCREQSAREYPYCRHCGAQMDEVVDHIADDRKKEGE